jgi:hypothetical protein
MRRSRVQRRSQIQPERDVLTRYTIAPFNSISPPAGGVDAATVGHASSQNEKHEEKKEAEKEPEKPCGSDCVGPIVAATIGGVFTLGGTALVIYYKKRQDASQSTRAGLLTGSRPATPRTDTSSSSGPHP